jgi:hypothetical protein
MTHSESLGCAWYRDQRAMDERMDDILAQMDLNKSPEIPSEIFD